MPHCRQARRRSCHRPHGRSAVAATVVLVACLLLGSPPATSADNGLSTDTVASDCDLILVRTAGLQTRGVLSIRLSGDYYESRDASSRLGFESPGEYTTLRLGARYGLTTWLEVCADLPARRATWPNAPGGSHDVTGLDAPVVGAKIGIPTGSRVLRLALGGRFAVPSGDEMTVSNDDGDEVRLAGGARTDIQAALLVTADLTGSFPLRLHANVGWAFNRNEDHGRRYFPDSYRPRPEGGGDGDNDAMILRGAIEFPGRNVDLFTEFRGDLTSDRDLVALKENPLTLTPGVRVRFGTGWVATGGLSVGMSGDDGDTPGFDPHDAYPDWQAMVRLSYAWPVFAADTDSDGIPDFRDECPRMAEDLDGFNDDDGCPDMDNDLDGIPDGFDGQPLLMEDYDGFEDDDGVPDLDNDADGIIDERDMCPDEPEDLDGFEDGDGCPDE